MKTVVVASLGSILLCALYVVLFSNNKYTRTGEIPTTTVKTPPVHLAVLWKGQNCALVNDINASMSCPLVEDWLPILIERLKTIHGVNATQHWTYVDVGANKGYGMLEMLAYLRPEGVHHSMKQIPDRLRRTYWPNWKLFGRRPINSRNILKKVLCGVCCDCYQVLPKHPLVPPGSSVDVVGVDLLPANAEWLKLFFKSYNSTVQVLNAGVSRKEGKQLVPFAPPGNEWMSLSSSGTDESTEVPIRTLPNLLSQNVFVDILSTDTEGYDYDVYYGARDLFVQRRVSVYTFEVNFGGRNFTGAELYEMVQDLSLLGYECAAPNAKRSPEHKTPQYIPLAGCGPGDMHRLIGWNNVLCYASWNETLVNVFREHVFPKIRVEGTPIC